MIIKIISTRMKEITELIGRLKDEKYESLLYKSIESRPYLRMSTDLLQSDLSILGLGWSILLL